MNGSSPLTTELLLEQVSWLRRLAGSLVADAALADDLVQETVAVALERPPRDASRLRAWLSRVLRRRAAAERRAGHARRAREAERAVPDEAQGPSVDGWIERLHLQRELAEELLHLDEPYRSTILLRFYEDLPPRAIARRQQVTVATVKSRLQRGLARLRERLDRSHGGDRRAWVLVLAPLAREPLALAAGAAGKAGLGSAAKGAGTGAAVTGGSVGIGGIVLNLKLVLSVLSVVVLGSAWLVLREDSAERLQPADELAPPRVAAPGPSAPAAPRIGLAAGEGAATASGERFAAQAPPVQSEPAATPAPAPTILVEGRVIDATAAPLAGLVLGVEGAEARAADGESAQGADGASIRSQDGGRFRFETTAESGVVDVGEAARDEWVAIRKGTWRRGSALEPIVVCAPAVTVAGRVSDEAGAPVEGARVLLRLPDSLRAGLDDVLDASLAVDWQGWSDARGRFELPRAPLVDGLALFVAKDGFVPRLIRESEAPLSALEVVLRRVSDDEQPAILGRVLLSDGAPATRARVSLGVGSVPSDEQGFFTLPLGATLASTRIVAAQEGWLPASMERPGDASDALEGWPEFVELVLGPPALSIRGRVVDHEGRGRGGAYVWVEDATPFGTVGTRPLFLEAWLAGGGVPRGAIDSLAELPAEDGEQVFGSATPLEEPSAMLWYTRTDPDGGFTIPGLLERSYDLRAIDQDLRWDLTEAGVAAGTADLELRLGVPDVYETVVVRVETRHGDPVPGVRVLQWTAAADLETRVFGGTSHVTRFLMGPEGTSDAEGRVVFHDVPRERIELFVASDEILPTYASIESMQDPERWVVPVAARAFLQFEASPPEAADAIEVTDEAGERQLLLLMRADGYSNFERFALTGGRSGTVTVTSDAAFLHVLKDGERVDSLPLVLRPGEVHELRWRP